MTRLKHKFDYEPYVGAKPPGEIEVCTRCGTRRLRVQGYDAVRVDTMIGNPFFLFRSAVEGGWSTHNPRCK